MTEIHYFNDARYLEATTTVHVRRGRQEEKFRH